MASANAKIKQAGEYCTTIRDIFFDYREGQIYEKKSKKKTTDISEEHARYINLINVLGPEVSQEK